MDCETATLRNCGRTIGWGVLLFFAMTTGVLGDTHYVWTNSPSPATPYTSWSTAAHVIQDAINEASDFDTVLVTNGVYTQGSVYDKTGMFTLHNQFSRFAATNQITVRSVNGPRYTIVVGDLETTNYTRGAYLSHGASLIGFTLTGGHGGGGAGPGAGCYIVSGSLSNCLIYGNSGLAAGGGICGSAVTSAYVVACTIASNASTIQAGGVFGCTLKNCLVDANTANVFGGGLSGCQASACIIRNNVALNVASNNTWGGGAYGSYLSNCLIYSNATTSTRYQFLTAGGGVYAGTAVNCTLVANHADGQGGGECGGTMTNCIAYYNTADISEANWGTYGGQTFIYNSCTTPLPTYGSKNITQDPAFLNLAAGDYHLAAGSPCIDAGTRTNAPSVDFDGIPRPLDGKNSGVAAYDMGCYEYVNPLADTEHDGWKDVDELAHGWSPVDPAVPLFIQAMSLQSAGAVVVTWSPSVTGRLYTVLGNTNLLANGSWANVPDFIDHAGTGSSMSYTTTVSQAQRSFRVQVR